VRVSRYAALTVFVWSVVLQVLAGEPIPEVAAIGVVFVAFVPFLRGSRRRLAAVVGGLAVVALLGNLPATIDELTHPESAPAFILTLLVCLAAVTAIVAGVAALRRSSGEAIRATVITVTGLFLAGMIVAFVAAAGVDAAAPADGDVQVVAKGVEFDQSNLVVVAGGTGFWVDNQDGIRHTFTIEGTGYQIDVPALSAQRAEFDLDAGRYTVICTVPGHENMSIDLTVEASS
jgi:plastocyanin